MATIASRLTNTGTLLVNGTIDEFTGAPVVDSSLTMWLDFGQTSSYTGSGTTVYDLSPGRTANVTLVGSPTFNSTDGGGAEVFNGTTQYGNGSGTPLGQTAYTKSFWFKLSSYGTNNNVVSGDSQFSYFGGGTKLQNGHSSWSSFGAFTSVTTFNLNTWYHACVTFNTATGMALYVNGVLDSTYVSTGANPTNVAVGGTGRVDIAQYGGGNFLAGSIGQVMIYNRALTAAEAQQNYNALAPRYGLKQLANIANPTRQTANTITSSLFDEVTYNPTASSSAIKNLLSYSQDFTNSAWANYQQYANSVIITGNVTTAPDGTLTAGKFASNNAVSTYYSYFRGAITINPNTAYTYSTYFKAAERTSGSMVMYTTGYNNTINFDLSAGTVTGIIPTDPALTMTGGISSVGNGWYRVCLLYTSPSPRD